MISSQSARTSGPDHIMNANPAPTGKTDVIIIGGGASGVMMAAHLLSRDSAVRVTLVEGTHPFGHGLAYSTSDPDHLLNTRISQMSAFPDDPDHFLRWMRAKDSDAHGDVFVSRQTYGRYLADLLTPWLAEGKSRLTCLRRTCLRLTENNAGVTAVLDDGQAVRADLAVLATGHAVPQPDPRGLVSGAWDNIADTIPSEGAVLIIGTGLSMVDQVLSLVKRGHRGPITALSRRGLLPRPHARVAPMQIALADIPVDQTLSQMLRWLRALARQAEDQGGTWRDVVDGLRPHLSAIWPALPLERRSRFLRHAAAWWDVHRHRIPPASDAVIRDAQDRGQLIHKRGAFLRAEPGENGGVRAIIRSRGACETQVVEVAHVIDCRGIRNDPQRHATPLIADLLTSGRAAIDPLRIGLKVDGDCRLIGADGQSSDRVLAIGPVSRAAFWEITAIPDIRAQIASLAARIAVPRSPAASA